MMELLLWAVFGVVVLAMLALDLFLFHRQAHEIGRKEAFVWSMIWIAVSLVFCAGIWVVEGSEKGVMFLTGYLIEKSLSVDNLFVIMLIFGYFGIPARYQHRVLSWGIIGALVMRAFFIFAGLALIHYLHWVIYLFGAFLIFTGVRMFFGAGGEVHPDDNLALRAFKRIFPTSAHMHGQRFFIRRRGFGGLAVRTVATPLFVALLVIETTDLIFAVDSIPAILAISTDPFIVFSSNIFAILGLRALYFLLAGWMTSLRFLKPGLAAILTFLGLKMTAADLIDIPVHFSLAFVFGVLLLAGVLSWVFPEKRSPE
jgi:tellurite resistance protein TerC